MYPYMGVQFNSTVLISIFITFWAQATIIGLLVVVWLSGISRWSRSTKFYPTSGPVSTGMGDRSPVRVAFAPVSAFNQTPRPTQPSHPSVGRQNEYRGDGGTTADGEKRRVLHNNSRLYYQDWWHTDLKALAANWDDHSADMGSYASLIEFKPRRLKDC